MNGARRVFYPGRPAAGRALPGRRPDYPRPLD